METRDAYEYRRRVGLSEGRSWSMGRGEIVGRDSRFCGPDDLAPDTAVPGAISRNYWGSRTDNSSQECGPNHARRPWLKPVSSLLQSIPLPSQHNAAHSEYATGDKTVASRYPPAPFAHPVPPLTLTPNEEKTFRSHEDTRGDMHHSSSRTTSGGGNRGHSHHQFDEAHRPASSKGVLSLGKRSMAIEPPRTGYHSRGDRGGSLSPRVVCAQDVLSGDLRGPKREISASVNDHLRPLSSGRERYESADGTGFMTANFRLPPSASALNHSVQQGGRGNIEDGGRQGPGTFFAKTRPNDNFNSRVGRQRSWELMSGSTMGTSRESEIYRGAVPAAVTATGARAVTSRVVAAPVVTKRSKDAELSGVVKRPPQQSQQSTRIGEKAPGVDAGVRRNRCLEPGCSKSPRYALPGQKAEYCSQHKMENYVDVKHPRCESEMGCVRQPTFGWEGEKARFCSAHKEEGMLDVKNPRCAEPGCMKRPRYGDEGERARFCAAHKFDDMVDLATRRGVKCGSPAKRSRDGPRSFAHDTAAASAVAPGAGTRRTSMPSFNLGKAGSAPDPKRGHTPAHAGGHRRATSESWIDFCPKRVFDTTTSRGEASSASSTLREVSSPREARGSCDADAETSGSKSAFHGGSSAVSGPAPVCGSRGALGNPSSTGANIAIVRGEVTFAAPAPVSPSLAASPSRSASLTCSVSSASSAESQPPAKAQRFDANDYEASAILLECRSGALLPRDSRATSP